MTSCGFGRPCNHPKHLATLSTHLAVHRSRDIRVLKCTKRRLHQVANCVAGVGVAWTLAAIANCAERLLRL